MSARCSWGVVGLSLVLMIASPAEADPGLLLIAHGSSKPSWNKPVLELAGKVASQVVGAGRYRAVRVAMLESARPGVAEAVAELEAEGCTRIVAVPLFIAPSGHSLFDVPAALGLYTSPEIRAQFQKENIRPASPKVPVTLLPTLSDGEILPEYVVTQVKALSKNPKNESVVVLIHGDPDHQPAIDRLLRASLTRACGATGIESGDWACVEVGQSYVTEGIGTIKTAAAGGKRVLVVGLYLSSTTKAMHDRALTVLEQQRAQKVDPLEGLNVDFSTRSLVEEASLVEWIVASARAALTTDSTSVTTAR